jgi:hypothetical protein
MGGEPVSPTLIGWFPRTPPALLLLSDIHMVRLLRIALQDERGAGPERQARHQRLKEFLADLRMALARFFRTFEHIEKLGDGG